MKTSNCLTILVIMSNMSTGHKGALVIIWDILPVKTKTHPMYVFVIPFLTFGFFCYKFVSNNDIIAKGFNAYTHVNKLFKNTANINFKQCPFNITEAHDIIGG